MPGWTVAPSGAWTLLRPARTGINLIAAVIGGITTTYTVVGGIRTVMVTEAFQSCMLMLGAVLTIALISWKLGGVSAWIEIASWHAWGF